MGFFSTPLPTFALALTLRTLLLIYGTYQDALSPLKYTDIDYFVFTDAARFLSQGASPYTRDTYRYTPLLAWLLYPTSFGGLWFSFGKVLFALSDVLAGWLIYGVLRREGMRMERAVKFAGIWLLNPMVAQISTRGSSEGLLCVNVVALLAAVKARRFRVAGVLLGLAVHLKIYPFIYAASMIWWADAERMGRRRASGKSRRVTDLLLGSITPERIQLVLYSAVTFLSLSAAMFYMYGFPFLHHTYLYHLTRIDHRHNFSPYNILLYLNSSPTSPNTSSPSSPSLPTQIESLAFLPQLLLSTLLIPLLLSKRSLASTMLAQTFTFVTFNKVCTSQYFLWYLVFLPFYLPDSTLLRRPRLGVTVGALWVVGQVVWLWQGYELEFLGRSTFANGLWLSSIGFLFVNIWILGIVIGDIGRKGREGMHEKTQ